jgi:hypothetical protein
MKQLLQKVIPAQRQQLWIAIGLCLAAGLIAFIWDQRVMNQETDSSQKPKAENIESAATYIPEGFVLVPIEVANFESLDSILGKFGVVDLFVGSDDPKVKPRRIAERVKILRAPLNPEHFAVLVPDSESQNIVAYSGALTVVVQNPNSAGPSLVKPEGDSAKRKAKLRPSRVIVEVPSDG